MRRTLRSTAVFHGVGLHGGRPVTARVRPARSGGIAFLRTDLPPAVGRIEARHDRVTDTRLCTRLSNAFGTSVGTVEHLMAALAGCGITDALVEIDGPEAPIMDGSAAPIVAGLLEAGIAGLPGPSRALRIRRPVEVRDGDRMARLVPAPRFEMRFTIDFEEAAIGTQSLALALTGPAVVAELADCRTFARLAEIELLHRSGLGRGGSLENAIVVDGGRVLNPGGLRRPDEFVRHKMLDAVGDLALAGMPIVGRYEAERGGHEMTNRLLHALFAEPEAYETVAPARGQLPAAEGLMLRPSSAETRIAV